MKEGFWSVTFKESGVPVAAGGGCEGGGVDGGGWEKEAVGAGEGRGADITGARYGCGGGIRGGAYCCCKGICESGRGTLETGRGIGAEA